LLALLTARKSTTSLHHRIAYLEKSDDQRQKEAVLDKEKNSQGGIKAGLVFSFKHRQLRNLMIVCFFFLIPSVATSTYQTVMVKSALMSEEQITQALYLYPVGKCHLHRPDGFHQRPLGTEVVGFDDDGRRHRLLCPLLYRNNGILPADVDGFLCRSLCRCLLVSR
jgi:hypothetical protein